MSGKFLIYGATGYTGKLTAKMAASLKMKPILSGRNEAKLKEVAERLGLEYQAVSLEDTDTLEA